VEKAEMARFRVASIAGRVRRLWPALALTLGMPANAVRMSLRRDATRPCQMDDSATTRVGVFDLARATSARRHVASRHAEIDTARTA